jgi:hypothetical protein
MTLLTKLVGTSMIVALAGMIPLVLAAALAGADAPVTYAVAAVTMGPFGILSLIWLGVVWAEELREIWR